MKFILKGILLVLFGLLYFNTNAQSNELTVQKKVPAEIDTLFIEGEKEFANIDTLSIESEKKLHYPRKATIFSAVLPGLGQIYNKQIWKVPFIYGGFVGFIMAVNWNQSYYIRYKQAYFDVNDGNPDTQSYKVLNPNLNIDEFNRPSNLNSDYLGKIDFYSRQRNLVIIGTVAFYILNILDANVNAHFIDFDISEDLSLNFEPVSVNPLTSTPILGATLSYNF